VAGGRLVRRGRADRRDDRTELRIGGPEGESIGTITGPKSTDGYAEWTTEIPGTTGVHDCYLVDIGTATQAFHLDWFRFE
jgi:hypothetical protein